MNYSQQKASDLEFIDSSFLRMLNMKSQRKNGRFWPVMKIIHLLTQKTKKVYKFANSSNHVYLNSEKIFGTIFFNEKDTDD